MRKRTLVSAALAGLAVAVVLGGHFTVAKDAPKPDDLPRLRSGEWMAKLKADDLAGFFAILETDPVGRLAEAGFDAHVLSRLRYGNAAHFLSGRDATLEAPQPHS